MSENRCRDKKRKGFPSPSKASFDGNIKYYS